MHFCDFDEDAGIHFKQKPLKWSLFPNFQYKMDQQI